MDEQDIRFVDRLKADARLLARYGQQTGGFDTATLMLAIAKAEALADMRLNSPEIVDLQKLVFDAKNLLPNTGGSSIWFNLRDGWMPFEEDEKSESETDKSSGRVKGQTYLLIVVSILLVIVIGQLTQMHNQGTVLLSDLRVLRSAEPERRAGQLARQLIAAMKELSASNVTVDSKPASTKTIAAGPNNESAGASQVGAKARENLPLQAYFQIYDDARILDQKLNSISLRVQSYKDYADAPVLGARTFLYIYYNIQRQLGVAGPKAYGFLNNFEAIKGAGEASRTSLASVGTVGSGPAQSETLATVNSEEGKKVDKKNQINAQSSWGYPRDQRCDSTQIGGDLDHRADMLKSNLKWDGFADVAYEYVMGAAYLTCFDRITLAMFGSPPIDTLESEVSEALSPYAFWILPGFYGALGALLFYLRVTLNPILPNPPGYRIVHRAALGALAGMILAWFWVPDTTIGGQLAGIGLGLFTLAFVFGFSLDVFFALLDRFVALSTLAIEKVGAAKT